MTKNAKNLASPLRLANFNNANEPTSVENGLVYYNTTSNILKYYANAAWREIANKAEVVLRDGSQAFTADQSMGGFKLTNLAAPAASGDAANKNYVDTQGMKIGNAVVSGTTGSLLFVGSGPVLSQNNANLFWDNTNARLGIGTTSTTAKLRVLHTGTTLPTLICHTNQSSNTSPVAQFLQDSNSSGPGIAISLTSGTNTGAGIEIGVSNSSAAHIVGTGNGLRLKSADNSIATSAVSLKSGNSSAANSGSMTVATGTSGATSGALTISTGTGNTTGDLSIFTANANNAGAATAGSLSLSAGSGGSYTQNVSTFQQFGGDQAGDYTAQFLPSTDDFVFTANQDGELTEVQVQLKADTPVAPGTTMIAYLYDDTGSTLLATSDTTFDLTTLTNSYSQQSFLFTTGSLTIDNGTDFMIRFEVNQDPAPGVVYFMTDSGTPTFANIYIDIKVDQEITGNDGHITITSADYISMVATNGAVTMSGSDITATAVTAVTLAAASNVALKTDTFRRSGSPSSTDFVDQIYKHAITLTASQTNTVASALTYSAAYDAVEIFYRIKEATTNRVRTGQLWVATDGTLVSITDQYAETDDVGVTWTAAINGANVELKYTTTANNKIMRADIRRISSM